MLSLELTQTLLLLLVFILNLFKFFFYCLKCTVCWEEIAFGVGGALIVTKCIFTEVVILAFLTKLGETRLTVKTAIGVM